MEHDVDYIFDLYEAVVKGGRIDEVVRMLDLYESRNLANEYIDVILAGEIVKQVAAKKDFALFCARKMRQNFPFIK